MPFPPHHHDDDVVDDNRMVHDDDDDDDDNEHGFRDDVSTDVNDDDGDDDCDDEAGLMKMISDMISTKSIQIMSDRFFRRISDIDKFLI